MWLLLFFFSSRRRHTRLQGDWSSDVCSSDLVIDIDGDASIRMNIGELETVTSYDLPIKVVVLNNSGDGMVRQWQKLFFQGRFSASDKSLRKKDFVKAAEADGFGWARRVQNPAELE